MSINILLASFGLNGQGSLHLLKQRIVKDLNSEFALIERGVQAAKKFATLEELTVQEMEYLQGFGKRVGAVTAGLLAMTALGLGAYFGVKKLRGQPGQLPEEPISPEPEPQPEPRIPEEESEGEESEEEEIIVQPIPAPQVATVPGGLEEELRKRRGTLKAPKPAEVPVAQKPEEPSIAGSLSKKVGEKQAIQMRILQEKEKEHQQELLRQKNEQVKNWQNTIQRQERELQQKQNKLEQEALKKFGSEPQYQAVKRMHELTLERTRASLEQEKKQIIKSKQDLEAFKIAPIVEEESAWE